MVGHAGGRARGLPRARGRSASKPSARRCSRSPCARRERRSRTRWPKCARRSISCATTRRRRAPSWAAPGIAPIGPVVAISPWNFPLAIFVGEVGAALAAGNPVLAKPAEQTPLIAARGRAHPASRRRAAGGAAAAAGTRRDGRRGAGRGSARGRRHLHRLHRGRAPHPPAARDPRRRPGADRRDRRPERDDRRQLGAARAGGRGCAVLRVRQRRPALLGAAHPVPAGRRRAGDAVDARRRDARARGRRSAAARHRHRPGDRRRGARGARSRTSSGCARRACDVVEMPLPPECARGTFVAPTIVDLGRHPRSRAPHARSVRPGPARAALEARRAAGARRRDQRDGLRPDPRHPHADRRDRRGDPRRGCAPATSTSIATSSARSSACSRSAGTGSRARARRPAGRSTCAGWCAARRRRRPRRRSRCRARPANRTRSNSIRAASSRASPPTSAGSSPRPRPRSRPATPCCCCAIPFRYASARASAARGSRSPTRSIPPPSTRCCSTSTANDARRVRGVFAAAPGRIVPIVVPDAHGKYDWARLVVERTVTVNTAAAGGNAALLSLDEDAA